MAEPAPARGKRGPLVKEVAARAGVGPATVDRVLNGRGPVAPATRLRVPTAPGSFQAPRPEARRRIALLCESGDSFTRALEEAVAAVAARRPDLDHVVRAFS